MKEFKNKIGEAEKPLPKEKITVSYNITATKEQHEELVKIFKNNNVYYEK